MSRILLSSEFTLTQPDPLSEFGVPATIGLSVGVVCTVIISGLMSGLTLGLLSLDRLDLEVMVRTGTPREQAYAARLAPIVKYPHWVLATLVIFNTVSSVALPLCMDRLVSSLVALAVSSTAIVLFGEIVPQAVCSRHGLAIGGTMAPMVRVLMWVTAPLSWPIGWLLDWLLGTKGGVFGRRQLMALVDLHRTSTGMGGPLADDEFNVILGALDMTSKTAASNMTPLDKVFMLSTDDRLDKATLQRILESGHSRVPVYEGGDRSKILGLIITKELLQYVGLIAGPQAPPLIGEIELRDVLRLPVSTRMYHLLDIFQTGQSHMALLTAPKSQATCAASAKWRGGRLADEESSQEDKSAKPERRARRKRWRDKEQRRFISMISFGHAAPSSDGDGDGDGGARENGRATPRAGRRSSRESDGGTPRGGASRGASRRASGGGGGGSEVGDVEAGRRSGSSSPRTPLSPRSPRNKDRGGLLPCLGGSEVKHGPGDGAGDAGAAPGATRPRGGAGGVAGGGVVFDLARTSPIAASYADKAWNIAGGAGAACGGGDERRLNQEGDMSGPVESGVDEGGGGKEEEEDVTVGIITLEDVIEEMMGEEIVDETDAYVDNEKTTRVNARLLTMSLPPQLRRVLLSASLKHTAAVATAAALRGGGPGELTPAPAPKLKAWTSSPQLRSTAGGGGGDGWSGSAPAAAGDASSGAVAAAGAAAAAAAGAGAEGAQREGPQHAGAAAGGSWFGWRPATPGRPRSGGGGGGDAGSLAGHAPPQGGGGGEGGGGGRGAIEMQ